MAESEKYKVNMAQITSQLSYATGILKEIPSVFEEEGLAPAMFTLGSVTTYLENLNNLLLTLSPEEEPAEFDHDGD